jgi:heme exporter protein A
MNAVDVDHVWKYYGDFPALRDITFEVAKGDCVALLGRNGAGKTTLLRIIAGLGKAARGQVRIHGEDARTQTSRRRIGVLGHGIAVYDELSAFENLRIFAGLYDVPEPAKRAMEWLERTGLDRVRDGLVREFSRGMRQRLAVARAFLHEPDVHTIIMSTHQLREALELATHVVLMNRGKVGYQGLRTQEMAEQPGWLYAHYGEA